MNISTALNPIYMPEVVTPEQRQHMLLQSTPENQPANPYNTPVDGFVTRTIFGGVMGKNMAQLVFADAPGTTGLSGLTKNVYLRQAGVSLGVGAGIYAGLSVLKQGWGMMKGTQDARGAAANILTDAMRGGATGIGAAAGGGLTSMAMRAMGATGLFGTVVSFIGGAIGGTIGANLLESTGIRNRLVSAFASQKAGGSVPVAQNY